MVPNISGNGRSFRGAGAYHLHDKPSVANPRPRTAARVAFTATRNLANDDPRLALDEMRRTAGDAAFLKAASGAAARGRKSAAPVKTVSLAWAPGETPTQAGMIAAADGFLSAMGWREHQAVYAAHADTAHPHLHIILNRVHPGTGRTLNDWRERERTQCWALAYERKHGAVLCKARAARDEHRAPKPSSGVPYAQAKLVNREGKGGRAAITQDVRARFRPAWARHYRDERALRAKLDEEGRGLRRRAASLAREGAGAQALAALDAFEERRDQTLRGLARKRAAIGAAHTAALRAWLRGAPPMEMAESTVLTHVRCSFRRTHAPRAAQALPPWRSTDVAASDRQQAEQGRAARNLKQQRAASNDNRGPHIGPDWRSGRLFSARFRVLERGASAARSPPRGMMTASLRGERQQLTAMQAAARALLRRRQGIASAASELAESEIALAFASRWAEIRRLPAPLRAAAIAALKMEQAAALSTRVSYHIGRLGMALRAERIALSRQHAVERRALSQRHRHAWAAAAGAIKAVRPARAPPSWPGRGGVPARASPRP